MYKISIILPVFNVEDYLEESFNSILNQTFGFDNLEVIYVDDNSTDGSKQIIKSFVDKYDNVKAIFLEENSGYAGKPRNVGIENATSDYIMFLDPDDVFLDNACEFLYNEITNYDLNFISANFLNFENDEYEIFDWRRYFPDIKPKDRIYLNEVHDNMNIFKVAASVWAKIFKRQFIIDNNIYFPVGIAGEDLVFVVNCLTKTDNVLYINEPVVKYKIRKSGSATSRLTKSSLASFITAYKLFYDLMEEFDNEYLWLAARSVSSFWFDQLIASDLSDSDKVDLLKYAENLIEVLGKTNKIYIPPHQELFFKLCFEKKFYEAIELSKSIKFKEADYSRDEILNNLQNVFLLLKNYDLGTINRIIDLFKEKDYIITFLNIGETINFPDDVSNININEYYDYVVKNNGEVILNKVDPDFNLKFENQNDLYIYFVEEVMSFSKNALLLYDSDINMNKSNIDKIAISTNKFNDDIIANAIIINDYDDLMECNSNVYKCNDLFSKDNFAFFEDILFDVLIKSNFQNENKKFKQLSKLDGVLKENEKLIQENNKLKKKNNKLKKKNKKIKKQYKNLKIKYNNLEIEVDELINFKKSILNSSSWKMTKPLRKLKNLR